MRVDTGGGNLKSFQVAKDHRKIKQTSIFKKIKNFKEM